MALQAACYYPRLPDRVASHFNASGQPDGWMDKGPFLAVMFIPTVFVGGLFATIALGLRMMAPPKSAVAEQTVDAELAERRREVGQALAQCTSDFLLQTGGLILLLLLVVTHLAIRANLSPPPRLPHIGWVAGPFLVVLVLLLAWMARRIVRLERQLPPREVPPGVWFPAKRFGWGWGPPCRWQGWIVMGLWLAGMVGGLAFLSRGPVTAGRLMGALGLIAAATGMLLLFSWIKGEKPRWRWGD
jgi:hypothetical protein